MHYHKPNDYCDPECPPLNWPELVKQLVELLPSETELARGGRDWHHLTHVKNIAEGYLKTNRRYGR